MGVDHFYAIKAQTEEQYGGHFMLFEYLENEEVEQAYNIIISKVLCESESESQEEKKEDNPNTKAETITLLLSVFVVTGVFAIILKKLKPEKLA